MSTPFHHVHLDPCHTWQLTNPATLHAPSLPYPCAALAGHALTPSSGPPPTPPQSAGSLAAAESAAASPPGPAPADWLSLVPGLRPLLDSLSSLAALVSGLWADVAVYLVAGALMGAVQQVVGAGAGGPAGGRG